MPSPLPLAPSAATREGLDTAWADLGQPGTWWTAAERVAIAAEARAARGCRSSVEQLANLSICSVDSAWRSYRRC